MNGRWNKTDNICSKSCGWCCDILHFVGGIGSTFPTPNKHFNDYIESFFAHYEKLDIKPLFDWKNTSSVWCPYKGASGCIVPREKRHPDCLVYVCLRQKLRLMKPGDKIRFDEEIQSYTVQAVGNRYLICTKPFNLKHTTLYTIIDTENGIRGTENLIFGMGAESKEDCEEMLSRLESEDPEERTCIGRNRIFFRIKALYLIDDGKITRENC